MWNDEGGLSVKAKKIIIYLSSGALTIALFFIAYRFFLHQESGNAELYVAVAAVILTIVGYILSLTNDLISQQMNTKLQLSMDVNVIDTRAVITCTVENKGQDRIDPDGFYMFIDQPILDTDTGIYKVNHVLKHTRKNNCELSEICRKGKLSEYPQEFRCNEENDLYYDFKKLDFLSPDSMLYINSGECFSEDVVIKLDKGVYHVVLIGVFGKKGCLCANRQFVIE